VSDNQTVLRVSVFQGESPLTNSPDNRLLGQFDLTGIRPAKRGVPQIEVTFYIDSNGILSVTAKDLDTNKEAKIEIRGSSGLDPREWSACAGRPRVAPRRIGARSRSSMLATMGTYDLRHREPAQGTREQDRRVREERHPCHRERYKQIKEGDDPQAIRQAVSDLRAALQSLAAT